MQSTRNDNGRKSFQKTKTGWDEDDGGLIINGPIYRTAALN